MTDLRSRADELIDSAIEDARAETFNPSKYTREQAKESRATLTRFVHALCSTAELLKVAPYPSSNSPGHEQAWQCQWCDERKIALAALEKGEKV